MSEAATHMGDQVPNELDPESEREIDVHPEQKLENIENNESSTYF